MNYGFVKIAAAVPQVSVANPKQNLQSIETLLIQAEGHGAEIILFPELSFTGYTCGDLFSQQLLIDEAEMALIQLMNFTRSLDIISIVGLPVAYQGSLLNCAAVVQKGKILGLVPKTFLPNYNEFYEQRWFVSAAQIPADANVWLCGQQVGVSANMLFRSSTCTFGIELCEDLWAPLPPSTNLALQGADIIFNLSASNDLVCKQDYLEQLLQQQSASVHCGYVYAAAGFGESSQDAVFSGKAFIYENGTRLAAGTPHSLQPQLLMSEIDVERLRADRRKNTTFSQCAAIHGKSCLQIDTELLSPRELELTRTVNPFPFVPTGEHLDRRCREIFAIQADGLAQRLHHIGAQKAVVGISGGLDSTLALLVTVRSFDLLGLDRSGIIGITMPGFGTSDRTHSNAVALMEQLGISQREINISRAVLQHFQDIGHDAAVHDTTYENSQARERTQILMDVANQENAIVIGTGDLSELALGWCTYNGDHMSMYGVNAGVPKTLVRYLVKWIATQAEELNIFRHNVPTARTTLLDIVDTPISPELIPVDENGEIAQKTEDLVGPYELHDFFIYYALRYGFRPSKILFLAQHAFGNTYPSNILKHWLTNFYRRFFNQQFKRSCMPDGPKVGSVGLSPRGDWRMPSDAMSQAWLSECETL